MVQLKVSPIDGLAIQGSAAQTEGNTGLNGSGGTEQGVGANIGAKYTIGQITAGYTQGGKQAAVASGELTYYENKYIGIQFDVNDSLSVSYNRDESEKTTRVGVASGATVGTKSAIKMEQDSIQVAYTTGGATIGITQVEVDNADYTTTKKEEQTVVSLGISF